MQWDLERFFRGGSESEAFLACIDELEEDFNGMCDRLSALPPDSPIDCDHFLLLLTDVQDLLLRFQEASAYQYCLTNQDMSDTAATRLGGRIAQLETMRTEMMALLEQIMCLMSEEVWQSVCTHPAIEPIVFPLAQMRQRATSKMAVAEEILAGDLARDGFHAWEEVHRTLMRNISVPFEREGVVRSLTFAQVSSVMATLDATGRKELQEKLSQRIAEDLELFASVLNHMTGFRLTCNKHRGWKSVLHSTLDENRITEQTLEALLAALDANRAPFVQYLHRKAKLLGQTGMHIYDITVPVKRSTTSLPFEEAVALLIEHHQRLSPQMASFMKRAIDDGWVDVAERPHKRGGGFCVRFPLARESRVFLSYTGRYQDLACLAHELGHAYHQSHTMRVPALVQETPLTLGETASTFSEQIVFDAAIQTAVSVEEKVALLDAKLSLTVLFLLAFEFRFRFEQELYERREQGLLSVQELQELMEQMQKASFAACLESYQPYAWATYPLFYFPSTPFYNFQYLFGFLFSKSLFVVANDSPTDFADRYDAFLCDTGRMNVEELAKKHLGMDITQQAFWEQAIATCVQDVEAFLHLTDAG